MDRNESPFGVAPGVVQAWERQRTADFRKYGLNRYPDFFQTDLLQALAAHHGLAATNYTPLAGIEECGNVLAAALLRGGELLQPWPVDDPISRPARAWGARVHRVGLDRIHRQDLDALAAAVGPQTKLVHLQNPHDPGGQSFGQRQLERFLEAVAARNAATHVLVDESYAAYSLRSDFPDSFELIGRDQENSKLVVARTLSTAHGMAAAPTAFLAASRALTSRTEGVTTGFFVPGAYGWAMPECDLNRMSEKALLAVLSAAGDDHLARVREANVRQRRRLYLLLREHGLQTFLNDASFLLVRAPGSHTGASLSRALRSRGVAVAHLPGARGRYRRYVRISVGSNSDHRALDRALRQVLRTPGKSATGRRSVAPTRPAAKSRRHLVTTAAALAAVRVAPGARALPGRFQPSKGSPQAEPPELSRRDFLRWGALAAGTAGLAGALSRVPHALAFPPDGEYDRFNLVRMLYHENPLGPSPAALDAVRKVIGRGPQAATRYEEDDAADLVRAILRYNRPRRGGGRLDHRNVMLLLGSAEGLTLTADTFVGGGKLISEWPAYRIIRERVWQAGGTVIDVPLDQRTWQPDYAALKRALTDNPSVRLIHLNVQNNPIGTVLERGPFDEFASWVFRTHPRTVILADESDREYVEPGPAARRPDFLGYVAAGRNLIHLQTFSHTFGLTGLRVGYLIAPARLVTQLKRKRIRRPVNIFGHAAALASLRDRAPQIRRSFQSCKEGRDYIYGELDKVGLRYLRSQGQYVFLDTGVNGTAVWSALISEGVLTRYGGEWGMEGWLRVCPGLPDENERFIAALRAVLARPDLENLPPPPIPLPPLPIPLPTPRDGHGAEIQKLLPRTREGRTIARDLERRLRSDAWLASRLPPLRAPYRVVPAERLR